jgi:hypothetical protein
MKFGCGNCVVDGQKCECDEAVCHVPDEEASKALNSGVDYASVDTMPVSDE